MNPQGTHGLRLRPAAALAACLAAAAGAGAAAERLPAESRVTAVTVMPDRALVTRTFEVQLPAGRSVVPQPRD